jgi:acyl carrier protein
MTSEATLAAVRQSVVEALGVPADDVRPEATIFGDLAAESIDLLDILFRIERKLGVKIKAADLSEYVQGGIPDEQFGEEGGTVSAVGLAHLKQVMPQIDEAALAGKLQAERVITLFTVQNLADMVTARAGAGVR